MKRNTLSDKEIKNAKPRDKVYKLSDSEGLYLLVKPTGHKHWRMKYHYEQKEKLLAIGPYPEISLAEARERRFLARKQLASGVDPIAAIREFEDEESHRVGKQFQAYRP